MDGAGDFGHVAIGGTADSWRVADLDGDVDAGMRHRVAAAVAARSAVLHDASARTGARLWQRCVLTAMAAGVVGASVWGGDLAVVAGVTLTLVFGGLAAVRTAALVHVWRQPTPDAGIRTTSTPLAEASDATLPTYTVLVALYDEAAVVAGLVASLNALDYPTDKLDVVLLLEADDRATRVALAACDLPGHIRVLMVPAGTPRTKPRALCYGLARSRGAYVVVYDAEDRPEPDQLRKAAVAFATGGPHLGCLQARLNIYNPHDSLVAALFTVEYTALFDGLVPTLVAVGAPLPLGGTSNHFPRAVLDSCGGWDPWNVTEDADLGMRLARHGYVVAVLPSTTWEEAPVTWSAWLRQRTRWQKGWMQTWLVHTRRPSVLWRDLGPHGVLWLNLVLGGGLLAALAHPWLVLTALLALRDGVPAPTVSLGGIVWWAGLATLVVSAVSTIGLGSITLHRRGFTRLKLVALLLPLLWLPVSLAAYRAVWELHRRPFHWAKTAHGRTVAHRRTIAERRRTTDLRR